MKGVLFGTSALGTPILGYSFGPEGSSVAQVLVLGGVHGDETEGVLCAHGLVARAARAKLGFGLTIVPAMNVDGVLARTRVNGRGVDLNRNLPSKDWNPQAFNNRYPPGPFANSESENVALTAWLDAHRPAFVLSLHSFTRALINVNGACTQEAEAMAPICGYPIEPSIGYPTPGCLGTYAGIERGWPTITYEILRGDPVERVLGTHVDAAWAAVRAGRE